MKITVEIPDNELKSILLDVLGNVPALKASLCIEEPIDESNTTNLDVDIRAVFTNVRLRGIFTACGIRTFRDLLRFSMNELIRCRNFGKKSKQIIEEKLESLNLSLASQPEIWYWFHKDYQTNKYTLHGSQGSRLETNNMYSIGAETQMDRLNEKIRNEKR